MKLLMVKKGWQTIVLEKIIFNVLSEKLTKI